ncbi:MAG: hypothetical protein VKP62_06395 [Candidatus Sericytochromatia bacterium]|nr:hypothetical protein [Candidatus Sericytochromatia bacterium]
MTTPTLNLFTIGAALLPPRLFQEEPVFFNSPETQAAVTATTTAAAITTKADSAYVGFTIQPLGGDVYLGDAGVTTSTGTKVTDGEVLAIASKYPAAFYVISAGSVGCRVTIYKGTR